MDSVPIELQDKLMGLMRELDALGFGSLMVIRQMREDAVEPFTLSVSASCVDPDAVNSEEFWTELAEVLMQAAGTTPKAPMLPAWIQKSDSDADQMGKSHTRAGLFIDTLNLVFGKEVGAAEIPVTLGPLLLLEAQLRHMAECGSPTAVAKTLSAFADAYRTGDFAGSSDAIHKSALLWGKAFVANASIGSPVGEA